MEFKRWESKEQLTEQTYTFYAFDWLQLKEEAIAGAGLLIPILGSFLFGVWPFIYMKTENEQNIYKRTTVRNFNLKSVSFFQVQSIKNNKRDQNIKECVISAELRSAV